MTRKEQLLPKHSGIAEKPIKKPGNAQMFTGFLVYFLFSETGLELYQGLDVYFHDKNHARIHQSLDYSVLAKLYKPAA